MSSQFHKKTDRNCWSADEDKILLANRYLPNAEVAILLPGRSIQAIKNRRLRIYANPKYKPRVRSQESIALFKATMAATKPECTAKATAARLGWPRVTCKWHERLGERRYDEPATW